MAAQLVDSVNEKSSSGDIVILIALREERRERSDITVEACLI